MLTAGKTFLRFVIVLSYSGKACYCDDFDILINELDVLDKLFGYFGCIDILGR